jgi:hypothetical protein
VVEQTKLDETDYRFPLLVLDGVSYKDFMAFVRFRTESGKRWGKRKVKDIERAIRISWVRPIIENYSAAGMDSWRYLEGNGQVRHYLYAKAADYLVIIEEKPRGFYLVTGFYVDSDWKRKDLENKKSKCLP